MQFVTLASTLLGAALAAPAPLPDAKALAPRWSNIVVSDITLKGPRSVLESASIKLVWDDKTLWCSHKGIKHDCHYIDNQKSEFNFHMEDRELVKHDSRAKFWVSRKLDNGAEEVVSVDMGKITCGMGGQCTPEHNPAIITTAPASPKPQLKARGSDITSDGVTISDVEFHAGPFDYLTRASLKLQWGGDTVWCVHEPSKQKKCNNIDGKTNKDYSLELVDKAMFLHASVTRLVVSHKGEQRSFSLTVSCSEGVHEHCSVV